MQYRIHQLFYPYFHIERILILLRVSLYLNFFVVILEKPIRIPRSLSVKASSCLKGFLNKNPKDRLGCHLQTGFADIMGHLFFRLIDWEAVCTCSILFIWDGKPRYTERVKLYIVNIW